MLWEITIPSAITIPSEIFTSYRFGLASHRSANLTNENGIGWMLSKCRAHSLVCFGE